VAPILLFLLLTTTRINEHTDQLLVRVRPSALWPTQPNFGWAIAHVEQAAAPPMSFLSAELTPFDAL